eukprot:12323643-Ditylum_brightwellii.AAC.1
MSVKEQLQEVHMTSKLGHGSDGSNGAIQWASPATSSLVGSAVNKEVGCLEPLPWLCVGDDF